MRAVARSLVLTCMAASASCGRPKTPEDVAVEYQSRIDHVVGFYQDLMVWPLCEVPPQRGKACGLLANAAIQENAIEVFADEHCYGEHGPDCLEKFRGQFMGRVRKRYPYANARDVAAHCAEEPEKCSQLWYVEFMYLKSHGAALLARMKVEVSKLLAERKAAQREAAGALARRDAWAAGLAAMGQALQAQGGNSGSRCSSDFQCPYGARCAKDSSAMVGVCARQVDQYGNPTYSPPSTESIGPGDGQCFSTAECPAGFRCVSTSGGARGNCLR